MELIGSGFDGRVHDGRGAPVFGGEGVLQNLEFADGVYGQTQTIRAVANRASFHAADQETVAVQTHSFAGEGGARRFSALAAVEHDAVGEAG